MTNTYRVTRHRAYLGSDTPHEDYRDKAMSLADLLEELGDIRAPACVAKDTSGWTGRHDVKTADDIADAEMIEGRLFATCEDGAWRDFRDYLTICDGEGKPLCPREMFALLVMSEVVLL